jgi:hypothetical protein
MPGDHRSRLGLWALVRLLSAFQTEMGHSEEDRRSTIA